jgi:hypothetical protein
MRTLVPRFLCLITVLVNLSCSETETEGHYLGANSGYDERVQSSAEIVNTVPKLDTDDFFIANSGLSNDSLGLVVEHGGSGYYEAHLFLVRDVVQHNKYVAYLSLKCIRSEDPQADMMSYLSFSLEKLRKENDASITIELAQTEDLEFIYDRAAH